MQSQMSRSFFADIEMFMMVWCSFYLSAASRFIYLRRTLLAVNMMCCEQISLLFLNRGLFSLISFATRFCDCDAMCFICFFFSFVRFLFVIAHCDHHSTVRTVYFSARSVNWTEWGKAALRICVRDVSVSVHRSVCLVLNVWASHYKIAMNTYSLPSTFVRAHTRAKEENVIYEWKSLKIYWVIRL